ncbi:10265_t:CDS:2 [Ambispora leptoticha]|uniref:10265_t:CDS:1 n=1 Tax=Ambispora leptoticha TaxID=144679 RepID=A0A9N9DFG4_9GLOM|nr:10265_t:CDS:2 [Ambispora leptoticha]
MGKSYKSSSKDLETAYNIDSWISNNSSDDLDELVNSQKELKKSNNISVLIITDLGVNVTYTNAPPLPKITSSNEP